MTWRTNKYCPYQYKYELVEWAHGRWPDKSKAFFNKMSKSRLYAIFYNQGTKQRRKEVAW